MGELRHDYYAEVIAGLMNIQRGSADYSQSLDELYAADGIAGVIVDRPAEDALSRGFTVEGDQDRTILSEVDRLDAIQHFTDAVRWSRLNGGGAILILTDDGSSLSQPLNPERIGLIRDLKAYPITALSPTASRYTDTTRANYGQPIYYDITPEYGDNFTVHESRLLKVSGAPLTYAAARGRSIPWRGRSALEACRDDLWRYREALRLTREILRRKQQAVYKMKEMAKAIGQTLTNPDGSIAFDGKRSVMDRLALADMVRGVMTTVAVDGEDDFTVLDTNLSGISDVLGGYKTALSASSRMPVPILFGEGLSGLGNSGEGEQGIYHGLLSGTQERTIRPALERFVSLLWAQRQLRVPQPERWRVVFNPLWSPTEKEAADAELVRANARKTEAEALVVLADGQLISQEAGMAYAAKRWPELEIEAEQRAVMPDDAP